MYRRGKRDEDRRKDVEASEALNKSIADRLHDSLAAACFFLITGPNILLAISLHYL